MGSYSETPLPQEPAPDHESLPKEEVPLLRSEGLTLILNTPKGRGVFANHDLPSGKIIEISPVLVLTPEENAEHICKTELYHYTYNWPLPSSPNKPQKQTQAVVLGLGSLFNHSTHGQNIGWTRSITQKTITYTTLREIRAGEELCISYGSRLTFVDVEAQKYEEDNEREEDIAGLGGLGRIELD